MSVYIHTPNLKDDYQCYRVARSVGGTLRQAYFPLTDEGLKKAKALDDEWRDKQRAEQKKCNSPWLAIAPPRWNKRTRVY